jgi:hypothetical protein
MSSRSCGLAWDEERRRGVELSWGSEEGKKARVRKPGTMDNLVIKKLQESVHDSYN